MYRLLVATALIATSSAFGYVDCTATGNINPQGIKDGSTYVGDSNRTGCLKATTGLVPDPDPTAWGDAWIAWNIEPIISGGYFKYEYTFNDPGGTNTREISHFILGLSPDCSTVTVTQTQGGCIWGITSTYFQAPAVDPIKTYEPDPPTTGDQPGMPANLYGIKFDRVAPGAAGSVSFYSARTPVWQNFYAKDGNCCGQGGAPTYVYNAGFSATGLSYYVAAPDTQFDPPEVPEPGFYGVLAGGLAGLYFYVRRRQTA
ncbi:MAG: hypothetical protein JNL98_26455 [Bryobacterales bacterium]|nr:hypothetical protein [Bryobacterales bacterium]